ncbi:MAG: hypothetical protein WD317_05190 [Balneolaceae bacterium]
MYQQLRFTVHRESGQRKLANALLALATGVLALTWPTFLYYIAGGYLIAFSMIMLYYRMNSFLTALAGLSALLIFLFPELIPFTFAFFLAVFGLTFLITTLVIPGIIMLIFAGLIISYPGSVAYMIGAFLVLYGFTHLVNLIQESRHVRHF